MRRIALSFVIIQHPAIFSNIQDKPVLHLSKEKPRCRQMLDLRA
jgi:hypothetical protein